jgi:hypothetical protein
MHRYIALILAVVLLVNPAYAQPKPVQDIPPGEDNIVVVKKGDPAPFTGQLFDPSTALRWANWLEQYRLRLKADVELEQKRGELGTALWQQKYTIQKDFYEVQLAQALKDKEALTVRLNDRPWYTTVWFGSVLGVVGTGLLVGGTAYALHATR